MQEVWKEVVGFEGCYEISNFGNVRSVDRYDSMNRLWKGKELQKARQRNGYLFVTLNKDGKQQHLLVHRLVALSFIDNPNGFIEINHINEDKEDNAVWNLEWCDHKYNINFGTGHKRSAKNHGRRVRQLSLDGSFIKEFDSIREAAREIRRGHKDIMNVCNGVRHTSGGFRWEYV